MIFAGLMVLAALVFAPGWLPGVFALLAALQFLLEGIFVEITPARYLLIVAFVLAAPAAAYVAGAFLDSFTSESAKTDRFRGVSVVLAFV